jgi:hypothetical protein
MDSSLSRKKGIVTVSPAATPAAWSLNYQQRGAWCLVDLRRTRGVSGPNFP